MKKEKLKKILNALPEDDDTDALFRPVQKEIASLTQNIQASIEAKSLEEANKRFRELRTTLDLQPIRSALESLQVSLSEKHKQMVAELKRSLVSVNELLTNAQTESRTENQAELEKTANSLRAEIKRVSERKIEMPDFAPQIESSHRKLVALLRGIETDGKKSLNSLSETQKNALKKEVDTLVSSMDSKLKELRSDLLQLIPRGGGNMNRQIKVNGVDVLDKYTDFNLTGTGITATDNNTTKAVDIDLSGLVGGSTLADVSADSTTVASSLYTMTSTIPVEFRSSDGNPILYIDETNERIGIRTASPSDPLHVVATDGTSGFMRLQGANSVDSYLSLASQAITMNRVTGSNALLNISTAVNGSWGANGTAGAITLSPGGSALMTLLRSSTAVGILTSTPSAALDISSGNIALVLGADTGANTRTNATTKTLRVGGYHYTNTEEPVGLMVVNSTSTSNTIGLGGGSSLVNAATELVFYTASNNTTTTGTERMRINNVGQVGIGVSPSYGLDYLGTNGQVRFTNTATDATGKQFRLYGSHYTNAEEPLLAMMADSQQTTSVINIGGGSSLGNAATAVRFFAAADTITTTGTEVARFTIDGLGIGQTSPSSKLHFSMTASKAAAGVVAIDVSSGTVTLTGADPTTYSTMRTAQIASMTLVGTNANQTVTAAAALSLSAPIASTNVTITTGHTLLLNASNVGAGTTTSYGLTVNANTGGGTNYAAQFLGGNVGILTSTPTAALSIAEKLLIDSNGKLTKYNNVSTAGWGVPAIYGSGRATAQTAANASVSTYTVGAADGSFEISANVLVTTSSAENFTVTCAYTDEGNTARTITLNFQVVGGTIGTAINFANGAVPYEGIPLHIRAKASTAITIKTTGTFTGATYNVEGIIKQMS